MNSEFRETQQRPDDRARRSKDALVAATLAATYELLSEGGLGGVSVDEVSRRSGVAKTTIYRYWPTRAALLLDACSQLTPRPSQPDTGTLQGDLTALAMAVAQRLQTGRWSSVLPSVVDAAERDPQIAELHAQLHLSMTAAFRAVVERARGRGEIGGDCDPAKITAAIMAPLFYRRWFSREVLDEAFARSVVSDALSATV